MWHYKKTFLILMLFCIAFLPVCIAQTDKVLSGRELLKAIRGHVAEPTDNNSPAQEKVLTPLSPIETKAEPNDQDSEPVKVLIPPTAKVVKTDRKVRPPRTPQRRVLRFPKDCVVGRVYFRDKDIPMDWANSFKRWGMFVEATGDIHVPQGAVVRFEPYKIAFKSGWALSTLKPDDIKSITFMKYKDANGSAMKGIGRLTGLEQLFLTYCHSMETGLKHLVGLDKLKHMTLPGQFRSSALAHLKNLPSLERLTLNGPMVTDEKMVQIGKISTLKNLGICDNEVGPGLVHIQGLVSLRSLSLNGNRNYDIDRYLAHVAKLSQLESLDLQNTWLGDAGLANLKGMKNLKKLQLRSMPTTGRITDAGMAHLKNLKSLQYLKLPSQGITDSGFSHLAQMDSLSSVEVTRNMTDKTLAKLAGMKSLKSLNIYSKKITEAGMAELANCSSLKSLTLNQCSVNDAGLAHVAKIKSLTKLSIVRIRISGQRLDVLKDLPHLTSLSFTGTDIGQPGISNIGRLDGITRLNLSLPNSTKFGDNDLATLSAMNSLKFLRIAHRKAEDTFITDQGLENISTLTGLEYLLLGINCENVTDAGLKHLEALTSLKELGMSKSHITMAGIERLKKKLPGASISAPPPNLTMEDWRIKLKAIKDGRPVAKQRGYAK